MKKMEWLFKTPIAHRGLHNDKFAENSMSAFKAAIDKGLSIEIDVHMSKDGKVVVFHDLTLTRLCGDKRKIIQLDYSELKTLKLNNTEDTIPTLSELLELIDGKVGLLIEIKYRFSKLYKSISEEVYKLIKDYKGNVAIQSFSPKVVRWFKNNAPEVPRGLLATGYQNMDLPHLMKSSMRALNRFFGDKIVRNADPDFIAYNIESFPSPTMKRYRSSGIPFLTWTVREMNHLNIAKEWADNIIFENLDITSF